MTISDLERRLYRAELRLKELQSKQAEPAPFDDLVGFLVRSRHKDSGKYQFTADGYTFAVEKNIWNWLPATHLDALLEVQRREKLNSQMGGEYEIQLKIPKRKEVLAHES